MVESLRDGRELSDTCDDRRIRFLDRITDSLNTRRAIRALVLPQLAAILAEVRSIRERLDRIDAAGIGLRRP